MGELQHEPFQFAFNGSLKVAFQGSRITSDAGILLVRELDERLGLATLISEHLSDSRHGLNTQFSLGISCGSRSTAGSRATKTSTTRCACRRTRRFASSGHHSARTGVRR